MTRSAAYILLKLGICEKGPIAYHEFLSMSFFFPPTQETRKMPASTGVLKLDTYHARSPADYEKVGFGALQEST